MILMSGIGMGGGSYRGSRQAITDIPLSLHPDRTGRRWCMRQCVEVAVGIRHTATLIPVAETTAAEAATLATISSPEFLGRTITTTIPETTATIAPTTTDTAAITTATPTETALTTTPTTPITTITLSTSNFSKVRDRVDNTALPLVAGSFLWPG